MRLLRLQNQERKLDNLFIEVSKLDEDHYFKPHLAKYLCIQVSGYLENVVKELVSNFHDKTCKKETGNFVNKKLKNFTNVDDRRLCELLNSFNIEWETKYSGNISKEKIESLNSVVSQRHLIAHGQESRSNITYNQIVKYFQDLKVIVSLLEQIIIK